MRRLKFNNVFRLLSIIFAICGVFVLGWMCGVFFLVGDFIIKLNW